MIIISKKNPAISGGNYEQNIKRDILSFSDSTQYDLTIESDLYCYNRTDTVHQSQSGSTALGRE